MIIIYEEDGKTVYAIGFNKQEYINYLLNPPVKPNSQKKHRVRKVNRERNVIPTDDNIRKKSYYRNQTNLQRQKSNANTLEYYHNVIVPRKLGMQPHRKISKGGTPIERPEPIIFHGKSNITF